jgi:integrase
MRGRKKIEGPRVVGPTWIPSKGMFRLFIYQAIPGSADCKRNIRWADDFEAADLIREKAEEAIARSTVVTIAQAIDAYEEAGNGKRAEVCRRLRLFFPRLEMGIGRVTPEHCEECYVAFQKRLRPDGQPISVSYHRATLINARSMMRFAMKKKKWITSNPVADVEGEGDRNFGKEGHTGNEARVFYVYCLERARMGDPTALALLMALLMALRTKDIRIRVVRDVDLDASVLRVRHGKSKKSDRNREIPHVLRPMLRELVANRDPFEPLFFAPHTESGFHGETWLSQGIERICRFASLPRVTPHALKGTAGTILAETGAAANAIADHLSHESFVETTGPHYVDSTIVDEAQLARAFTVIAGGGGDAPRARGCQPGSVRPQTKRSYTPRQPKSTPTTSA